jgi:hypothetical protein
MGSRYEGGKHTRSSRRLRLTHFAYAAGTRTTPQVLGHDAPERASQPRAPAPRYTGPGHHTCVLHTSLVL